MTITAEAKEKIFTGDLVEFDVAHKTVTPIRALAKWGVLSERPLMDCGMAINNFEKGRPVEWDLEGNTKDIMTNGTGNSSCD